MNFISLIEIKRDGGRLSDEQIHWLITEFSADRIPDYQMSSMAESSAGYQMSAIAS